MLQAVSAKSYRPLKIAFVTGGVQLGGATIFVYNLAGELVRRGHEPLVLSFESANPLESDFKAKSIRVICQNEAEEISEDRLENILRELARFKPDAVIANLGAVSFEALRYLPKGIHRVGVIHSDDERVFEMVARYTDHLDLIAAVSSKIEAKLKQRSELRSIRVVYAPLGVPMPEMEMEAKRDALRPLRLLYVGRIDREAKRVHLFPEIFRALKDSRIPFHWTIAGDGPELSWVRENIGSSTETQTVQFPGKLSYETIPKLMEEHDVFLLTSDYEGLPLSLLEAMGHGLVPVVSDLPSGIRELVNPDTGRLVDPSDIAGYSREIVWLHGHRPELARISLAAQKRVRDQFSVQAMADRWLSLLPEPSITFEWPAKFQIKRPLGTGNSFTFSEPGKFLRRAKLKFIKPKIRSV